MAKRVAATGPVDGPWALPDGWRWERLGAVAHVNAGQSPPSAQVNKNGEGLPFFQGKADFGAHHPTARNWCAKPTKIAEANDVLISVRAPVGPTNYALERCGIGRGLAAIRSDTLCQRYIRHWLAATGHSLREKATGTTFEAITGDVLRHHVIPVPPSGVDETIVARIDELFAEVDDGEAALARARDDLATWRKALLKAAVTGELTADWRADNPPTETGADLLAELVVDRRACWVADPRNAGKRYADAGEPMLGEVPDLPANWTWVGIEQLTTGGIRNGLSLKEAAGPTAVKGLKLDALQSNGIDWSRTRHLPIDLSRAAPYLLRAGDLLISRANGSPEFVGRCTMVDEGRDDTVFPDTAIRYPIVAEPRLRAWAKLAWRAPQSRKRMLALAKSTSGILKISQGDIAAVALPLPPLDEIGEIVARVERLTAEAEAGADDLASMKSIPATLRQSILAAAFRGDFA